MIRTAPAELTWQMWTEVPTYSAIRMSRITMMSSEIVGIPGMPSCVEARPSFMRPPFESCQSSQWATTGRSREWAYSRARFMSPACMTGLPSSENPAAPASLRSPNSVSVFPSEPLLTAAMG